jgi:hypothetical protein
MKKITPNNSKIQKVNKKPAPNQNNSVDNQNIVEILKQTYKQGNLEILAGIGVIVEAINKSNENTVKAITDSNKNTVKAITDSNEKLIKVITENLLKAINDGNDKLIHALTGENSRINNSHKNNNIENNLKGYSKNNNNISNNKDENIKFKENTNKNINKNEDDVTVGGVNFNPNDIIDNNSNQNLNEPSIFSIQSKEGFTIKNSSNSHYNNSSCNNNNIINENLSSDNSFPKRTVLVKDRKNKYSLSKIQKTDFSIYKSCLNPKEQKKKKRGTNPFLPNNQNKPKNIYSFIGNKNAKK